MSKLISGKEALIALANGEEVEIKFNYKDGWNKINLKDAYSFEIFLNPLNTEFRLKPRTITINEIEAPAPFNPPENLDNSLLWWVLDTDQECGYSQCRNPKHPSNLLGAWSSENEIKQIVSALRSVFKPL